VTPPTEPPEPERMRRGVRLALDVGTVRVGVAASDPSGLLAMPVTTVRRDQGPQGRDLEQIRALVTEHDAVEVVVGLPRGMSGQEGASAQAARAYAVLVARMIFPVPVRLVDERLSTVSAHRALHAAGRRGRSHRAVVDQVAAVTILQSALDAERAASAPPGEPVIVPEPVPQEPETRRHEGDAE
jgi:putative pre-16S rRNA nuclease